MPSFAARIPERLTSHGHELDLSPEAFGELRDSSEWAKAPPRLRERFEEDGYLFLRGFFKREDVLEARRHVMEMLAAEGHLKEGTDPMKGIARPGSDLKFKPEAADHNEPLQRLLYTGRIMEFYSAFFGEEARHFDFTWFRAISPGLGTQPHCDMVYMGRGTRERLYTAWVPIGDAPLHVGGLMILEHSHRQRGRFRHYLERDVDTYCLNGRHAKDIEEGRRAWEWSGALSSNPVTLREKLGGRWLTAEFEAGDLLTFSMCTVHASLDNASDCFRLSSDSRYQPASEPADERGVGKNPIAHGLAGKRGRIC